MKALSTNCIYYKAYLILAKLDEMLGKDGSDALKKAEALKAAINKAFWNEAKGSYDYLAGECDYQEALGISYALLFGIADERQTELVLKNVKVTEQGIACVEPSFDRYRKAGGFGRHSGVVWPHAQGFWACAAFEKGDRKAFEAELHALAGKANRDGQFYEVYHPETGEAYGGLQEKRDGQKLVIGDWMSCPHQTWSATAYLSLIYYHVLGADIREGEVVFKPYLPEVVNEIAVKDFKVGETTFDVVVVRGGDGPTEAVCKTTEKKRVKLFLSVEE
jgi:glycogen debranching enzyme